MGHTALAGLLIQRGGAALVLGHALALHVAHAEVEAAHGLSALTGWLRFLGGGAGGLGGKASLPSVAPALSSAHSAHSPTLSRTAFAPDIPGTPPRRHLSLVDFLAQACETQAEPAR